MEDYRQNSLREHVHFWIDARHMRLVSPMFLNPPQRIWKGKRRFSARRSRASPCAKDVKKPVNKKVQVSASCTFVQGAFKEKLPQNEFQQNFYMDSFEAHDQRKLKTKYTYLSGRRGPSRLCHATRAFSPATQPFI
jgi:hypothetical protein